MLISALRGNALSALPALSRTLAVATLMMVGTIPLQPRSAVRAVAAGVPLVSAPTSLVDPFIGTAGPGNESPGATTPFGMVTWGPDTPHGGDGSGYRYGDTAIKGFSVVHLPGVGCLAAGDIPVLPATGAVNPTGTEHFAVGSDRASPGYYRVTTSDHVTTELTATTRTGMAQFTFPAGKLDSLILMLSGDGGHGLGHPSAFSYTVLSDTEIAGSVTSGNFCKSANRYTVHFDMVFNVPFAPTAFKGAARFPGARKMAVRGRARGASVLRPIPADAPDPVFHGLPPRPPAPTLKTAAGVYLSFGKLTSPLQARVGVSYVSQAGAKANLAAEQQSAGSWEDFAAIRAGAAAAWGKLLGKIRVSRGNLAQERVFYTALYHALSFPTVFSDVNGEYLGVDGRVHTVDPGHAAFYTNFSGWDVYRTQSQLLALLDPSVADDAAQSIVDDYQQSGRFPKWLEYNGEADVMTGDPANAILADYYAFGATGFDTAAALRDMVAEGTYAGLNRPGLNYLTSPGYLPTNGVYCLVACNHETPASDTLENGVADFAISAMAKSLGHPHIAAEFLSRAQDWQNLLNPVTGLMEARTLQGAWVRSPKPPVRDPNFSEGSAWQYTGMVPYNIAGLARAMGGKAAMRAYLGHVLSGYLGSLTSSVSDMGNEPSLELPWEYDYVGQPFMAQRKVRQIQGLIWKDRPAGLAGNDDLGTMSAWFVWSALGMYPMTPGTPVLALSTPLFTRTVITLPSSATLTLVATGAARHGGTTEGSPYIRAAAWQPAGQGNGRWNAAYLPAGAITGGGVLKVSVSPRAKASWGASGAPPSFSGGAPSPDEGVVVSGIGTRLCLDATHKRSAGGTKVVVSGCDGGAAQLWSFGAGGAVRARGGCLTPASHKAANGVKVVLSACGGGPWQSWRATPRGQLVNAGSGRCLEGPRSSGGMGVWLRTSACGSAKDQLWRPPHSSPPPPVGQLASAVGGCAAVAGVSFGSAVELLPCGATPSGRWVVESDGTIHSGLGGCLDVAKGGVAAGTPVDYQACANTAQQQWLPQPGGALMNPRSGLCLDAPGGAGAAQLVLADCAAGSPAQQWTLP